MFSYIRNALYNSLTQNDGYSYLMKIAEEWELFWI